MSGKARKENVSFRTGDESRKCRHSTRRHDQQGDRRRLSSAIRRRGLVRIDEERKNTKRQQSRVVCVLCHPISHSRQDESRWPTAWRCLVIKSRGPLIRTIAPSAPACTDRCRSRRLHRHSRSPTREHLSVRNNRRKPFRPWLHSSLPPLVPWADIVRSSCLARNSRRSLRRAQVPVQKARHEPIARYDESLELIS